MTETSGPIAYLTSVYPAVSHTFVQREIAGVEAAGLEVAPCSIRQPPADHLTGPEERADFARTFYVLRTARRPLKLLGAQMAALARPGRYLSTLKLAWSTSAPGLRARLYQLIYFVEATVLAQHLRAIGARHLHVHFGNTGASVAMLAARLAEIPFSYTLHGPSELFEAKKLAMPQKTAQAAFVTCISHFARSQGMLFSDPAHWHKLRIVHCGVWPDVYDPEAAGAASADRPVRLVFVGRVAPVKGLRVLLEAFGAARAQGADLHLTIVGDGEDRAHLERLAAPFGAAVHFAGYQSQQGVAEAMAAADIFVLPSFAEGVPVVLMEAMASGKPVISSLVAGIPELVEDGVSGYLVPPGDAQTLTARIVQLAADPDRRAAMGQAGRAKVVAEFDIRVEAARIARLFVEGPGEEIRPQPWSSKQAL
jgi:glycosyltransferase involved in cell wall biosynthesis